MIVFLHIPKTAGTTFQFILGNTFGASACHTGHLRQPVFRQADWKFTRRFFPRAKSLAGHNLANPLALDLPNPFHLTFLRDPVARLLSQYQDSILKGAHKWEFEEFLKCARLTDNLHVRLMAGELNLDKAKQYLERCHFVGLTEKFDLSLHILQKLSPLPLNLNYQRRRTARTHAISQRVAQDPRLVELARAHNRLDLELYDFAAREIFPKFCAGAGLAPDAQPATFNTYTTGRHWRFRLYRFYNLSVYRQFAKFHH